MCCNESLNEVNIFYLVKKENAVEGFYLDERGIVVQLLGGR